MRHPHKKATKHPVAQEASIASRAAKQQGFIWQA